MKTNVLLDLKGVFRRRHEDGEILAGCFIDEGTARWASTFPEDVIADLQAKVTKMYGREVIESYDLESLGDDPDVPVWRGPCPKPELVYAQEEAEVLASKGA